MTGDHENRVTDYTALIVEPIGFNGKASPGSGSVAAELNKAPTIRACYPPNVCYPLNEQIVTRYKALGRGTGLGVGDKDDPAFTLQAAHPHMVCAPTYATSHNDFHIRATKNVASALTATGSKDPPIVCYCTLTWIVRRLTPLECERLQGYPDYWTCLPKIESISDTDFEFWQGVIKTHKAINGKKAVIPATKEKMIKWYNKLETDGSRYKALGNSLAIPNALRVVKGIADYVEEMRIMNNTE